jgi:hypothetical protein
LNPICQHYEPLPNKACQFYKATEKTKIGLCLKKMKATFLCQFSEKHLGIYKEDARIIRAEEL